MVSISLIISSLLSHGVPFEDVKMLVCIAEKESRFNPKAVNKYGNRNGTRDHGLFQINDANKELCDVTSKQLLNVNTNIKCAVKVYQTQNLKAWATYKLCKEEYRRYNVRNDSI